MEGGGEALKIKGRMVKRFWGCIQMRIEGESGCE